MRNFKTSFSPDSAKVREAAKNKKMLSTKTKYLFSGGPKIESENIDERGKNQLFLSFRRYINSQCKILLFQT